MNNRIPFFISIIIRTYSQSNWHFKIVSYNIPEGCIASYFPETNVLVPLNNVAKTSNTPASKFVEVSVSIS